MDKKGRNNRATCKESFIYVGNTMEFINAPRSQDARSVHKNQSWFYILSMNMQKTEIEKHYHLQLLQMKYLDMHLTEQM